MLSTFFYAIGASFILFLVFAVYTFALSIGGVFVKNKVRSNFNDVYTPGDIISIFFGIVFSLRALGDANIHITTILRGKSAASNVFHFIKLAETIDEEVEVFTGSIEFKNVSFKYEDQKENVLENLNLKFV